MFWRVRSVQQNSDHKREYVDGRLFYFCLFDEFSYNGGRRFWDLGRLSLHRLLVHNLPLLEALGCIRPPRATNKRSQHCIETTQRYMNNKVGNIEYHMIV